MEVRSVALAEERNVGRGLVPRHSRNGRSSGDKPPPYLRTGGRAIRTLVCDAPRRRDVLLAAVAVAARPAAGRGPAELPPPRTLTLAAAGDVTLGFHLEAYLDELAQKGMPLSKRLSYPFERVQPILDGVDLCVVNLECPFTERGERLPKNFNFRARPELVGALLAAGVDAVSLANNHMMDWGADGLADTLATLDQAGVARFGAGRTLAEARKPAVLERRGVKLGLLGYFFLGDRNIEPPAVLAGASRPGVAGTYKDLPAMEKMLVEDLAALRGQVDVPVVFWHWGREATHELEPYQPRLGRLAVEHGARLVLGSHPHVLQGVESYRGVPIVYSLGNFVFGGNSNPKNKDAAVYKATITPSGVTASELMPVQVTRVPEAPFQPFLLEGEPAQRVLSAIARMPVAGGKVLPELDAFRGGDSR